MSRIQLFPMHVEIYALVLMYFTSKSWLVYSTTSIPTNIVDVTSLAKSR